MACSITRAERSNGCLLPHSRRQVGTHWHLSPSSNGHFEGHQWTAPAWPTQVPCRDAGGVAEEITSSPNLVCHHWCCGVSRGGTAWEKTQRKVSTLNKLEYFCTLVCPLMKRLWHCDVTHAKILEILDSVCCFGGKRATTDTIIYNKAKENILEENILEDNNKKLICSNFALY